MLAERGKIATRKVDDEAPGEVVALSSDHTTDACAGGDLASLGEHAHVVPVISASRGRIELTSARRIVPHPSEWRAEFDLALTSDIVEPVNLRLYLSLDGQALTETWLYQYTPPPPAQRKV